MKLQDNSRVRVLVAPLDWGLGHATRCIPIIRYLLAKNCEVTLAGEGAAATLLKSNFPNLKILPLKGYRIAYSKSKVWFVPRMLIQIPKILGAIRSEERWLDQMKGQFDIVISDNRYGLYSKDIYSIILTHQLQIKSGIANWVDKILLNFHKPLLERFDECWVVDEEKKPGLAGELSHPSRPPRNAKYIGLLSQLQLFNAPTRVKQETILILLSGPEPMRGILQALVLEQVKDLTSYSFTLIAGNPTVTLPKDLPDHLTFYNYANAAEVAIELEKADLVICRSGYSTLMDLAWCGKRALLIPTPGQAEQEYLAEQLDNEKICLAKSQDLLSLKNDIPKAFQYGGFKKSDPALFHQSFQKAVDAVLI